MEIGGHQVRLDQLDEARCSLVATVAEPYMLGRIAS